MLKNDLQTPEAYVSPAIKEVKAKTRRVMCQSPTYGNYDEAGDKIYLDNNGEDIDL